MQQAPTSVSEHAPRRGDVVLLREGYLPGQEGQVSWTLPDGSVVAIPTHPVGGRLTPGLRQTLFLVPAGAIVGTISVEPEPLASRGDTVRLLGQGDPRGGGGPYPGGWLPVGGTGLVVGGHRGGSLLVRPDAPGGTAPDAARRLLYVAPDSVLEVTGHVPAEGGAPGGLVPGDRFVLVGGAGSEARRAFELAEGESATVLMVLPAGHMVAVPDKAPCEWPHAVAWLPRTSVVERIEE